MREPDLESLVKDCLDKFYERRLKNLSTLDLRNILQRKNPYLFKAMGLQKASDIVEHLLQAHVSSSDEGIFGDAFFEPIVKGASGGTVSPTEGVDVVVETPTDYKAISVKSGPNIFNASQAKRMNQEFMALRSRLYKVNKKFDALLGHGYGRKCSEARDSRVYRIRSGQAFWEEVTGDSDFYLKLVRLMKDYPGEHRKVYQVERDNAVNRFTRDFLAEFAAPDGAIDWEKLVRFNSGKEKMQRESKKTKP